MFDELHDSLPWQQTEVLRYDRYVPERRLGVGVRNDAHPMLHQTDLHLRSRFRVPFTGVAAILYRNGDDFQGLHSDREMRWLDETVIAIVVLGARRPFVLRRRAEGGVPVERVPAGTAPDDLVLMPGEGDMLIMGGACRANGCTVCPRRPPIGHGSHSRGDGRAVADGRTPARPTTTAGTSATDHASPDRAADPPDALNMASCAWPLISAAEDWRVRHSRNFSFVGLTRTIGSN